MMLYGIFSMRWASASRGSVSGSGDSCEIASVNAVWTVYPDAAVYGCFFHFNHFSQRLGQRIALQTKYRDPGVNMFIRMLAALAFLPVDCVADSFDTLLEEHAVANAQPIVDYFKDTFVIHRVD